jgi:hypothetical protein
VRREQRDGSISVSLEYRIAYRSMIVYGSTVPVGSYRRKVSVSKRSLLKLGTVAQNDAGFTG